MDQKPIYQPIRRVVTGHDSNKTAKAILDGTATNEKYPSPGTVSTLIWCTDGAPAAMPIGEIGAGVEDMGARILGTPPPPKGTRFAIIDYPPGNVGKMHRTETIDYVIVLEGEIDMEMDESSLSLKQGDVLIQRGTNHRWINRSKNPARLAFVLVDAEPLNIGNPVLALSNP